jgi:hypothetical protein
MNFFTSPDKEAPVFKPILCLMLCLSMSLVFSGCATSKMTAVTKIKPQRGYVNLMVVFVKSADEITNLTEASYNANIKNKFNNLDDIKLRQHLEKTFASNVGTYATLVNKSSDYFGVGEEYDYQTFLSKVKETGAEGIIFINSKSRWNSESYSTYTVGRRSPTSFTTTDIAPNASFLCYLIDLKTTKPVWMAQSNVFGTTWDSYNSLNTSLAKDVGYKLMKEGFVYKQVSDMPLNYNNSTH